jgi:hypothetical protein
MPFCAWAIQLQRHRAIDRNGNNESALLFTSGAYRGSNLGDLFFAKGSIIAQSDFFCISHPQSDVLINEFPIPGRFPLDPTAMVFRNGFVQSSRKKASEK